MSNTLRLFSRTLAQVSPAPDSAPRAAVLAGALALALSASSVHAQGRTAYDLFPQYAPAVQSTQQSSASAESSSSVGRNVGRALGGVLGYLTGSAITKNPITRAVATAGGLLLGQEVADQMNQSGSTKQAGAARAEARPGAVRYAMYGSGAAPAGAAKLVGTKVLPTELSLNMDNLLKDMVAKRELARKAYLAVDQAEAVSVTNPRDAEALKVLRAAQEDVQRQTRPFTQSLLDYANAVDVLESKGFDVAKHRAAALEVTSSDLRNDLGLGVMVPAERSAAQRGTASLSDLREGAAVSHDVERQAEGIAAANQRMR